MTNVKLTARQQEIFTKIQSGSRFTIRNRPLQGYFAYLDRERISIATANALINKVDFEVTQTLKGITTIKKYFLPIAKYIPHKGDCSMCKHWDNDEDGTPCEACDNNYSEWNTSK